VSALTVFFLRSLLRINRIATDQDKGREENQPPVLTRRFVKGCILPVLLRASRIGRGQGVSGF
jgi:hypothetical protein